MVYGAWPYPSHPPAYYPPPPSYGLGDALLTGMAFATGVAVVGSLWGWARPGWGYGRGQVNVDVNRYNNINVNRTQITNNTWVHDGAHRGGVPYRDPALGDRYRQGSDRPDQRDALRERTQQVNTGGGLDAARSGARPEGVRQAGRPAGQDRAGAASRPQAQAAQRPQAKTAQRSQTRPAQRTEARPAQRPSQIDQTRQDRAAPARDRMPAAEARPVSRQQHAGGGAHLARPAGGGHQQQRRER
ncbi:DUF3300 domain-containing protein [Dankookia sp. P2]|uniref:DUF3300 domain-containing protein n=1 Tax=Dankookia sp. P2 TaxID=3423955 RepID=UPI003D66551E